jgi:hypothetical protein
MIRAVELYGGNPDNLKADDIPDEVDQVTIFAKRIKRAPETWERQMALFKFRFTPRTLQKLKRNGADKQVLTATTLAISWRMGERLREYLVNDNLEELTGAFIRLDIIDSRNPRKKRECKAFSVNAVCMKGGTQWVEYPPTRIEEGFDEDEDEDKDEILLQ